MRFSKFLNEKQETSDINSKVIIILHRIFSAIPQTHIERDDTHIELNVGQAIKDKHFKPLNLGITNGGSVHCRFAVKSETSEYYILVTTPTFNKNMSTDEIIKLLETKELQKPLHDSVIKYFEYSKNDSLSEDDETEHEKNDQINKDYEPLYTELIQSIKNHLGEFHSAKEEIQKNMEQTSNEFKKETHGMALKHLEKQHKGESFQEFMGIIRKLPEAKFLDKLNPENKKLITNRLSDFYEHYFKNK